MNKGMKNFELFSDFKNHREQRGHREKFLSSVLSMSWYEEINNELLRTRFELTLPEFVSVSFSSVFFSGLLMKQGFIADSVVKNLPMRQ